MKKPLLALVWLCVLGGLLYGITRFGSSGQDGSSDAGAAAASNLDPKALSARWGEIVSHAAGPVRGDPKARYTAVEFGDFQCPQCGKARPGLEAFLAKNAATVNFYFVHRPFPFYTNGRVMHQWAMPSAQASEAAAALGKFWPMYDLLYTHQDDLEPGFYGDYATQIGLDKAKFMAAYNAPAAKAQVDASLKFTNALGIQSTPTVLVHDNKTGTVWPYIGLEGTPTQPGVKALLAGAPWEKAGP